MRVIRLKTKHTIIITTQSDKTFNLVKLDKNGKVWIEKNIPTEEELDEVIKMYDEVEIIASQTFLD